MPGEDRAVVCVLHTVSRNHHDAGPTTTTRRQTTAKLTMTTAEAGAPQQDVLAATGVGPSGWSGSALRCVAGSWSGVRPDDAA